MTRVVTDGDESDSSAGANDSGEDGEDGADGGNDGESHDGVVPGNESVRVQFSSPLPTPGDPHSLFMETHNGTRHPQPMKLHEL